MHPIIAILCIAIALAAGASVGAVIAVRRMRRAFQRNKQLEQQVSEAQHMAYVGRLTSGLAHELRNPLSTLNLNLALMAEDLARPDTDAERRLARKIAVLKEETARLESTLDSFLRFAGRMELKRRRLDAGELVQDLLAFYEPQAATHNVTVRSAVDEGLPAVSADPDLLKQALLNLILNAQAAMADGGELMLRVRPQRDGVAIDVIDTGCGIPADRLARIFDAYYSTRPGGSGLGLPIVRRIIREHGGTIDVTSEEGRGTHFAIWLPPAPPADQPDARPQADRKPETSS